MATGVDFRTHCQRPGISGCYRSCPAKASIVRSRHLRWMVMISHIPGVCSFEQATLRTHNYLEHHLVPEFADFKAFHYEDYHCDVSFEGGVALANEFYGYRIELKSGQSVERGGVQTSVLRRGSGGVWRIVSLHNSSRKPK